MDDKASCTMFVEINSQRFPLELGQIYLLGKQLATAEADPKKYINLKEEDDIDEKHCILEVGVGDDVYIFDLFSLKGTYLNNERLQALEKTRLKNGDVIKVGTEQLVKFYHEQPEMSHDSSGFLESNKNTSDIVVSSPESTSQREVRMKRLNNNFLVPAVPPQKQATPNTSLDFLETELNSSTKSRRSDSFFIPETQFCKSRSSINSADLSIAESNPEINVSKKSLNYLNDDSNDDFCIPETQEPLSCSQRPRLLNEENKPKEKNILEEKSVDLQDDSLDDSEFRICTQDYNEGFGEVEPDCLTSQIIPIIKHNTVLLRNSQSTTKDATNNTSKLLEEEKPEKEMSALQWNDSNLDLHTTDKRADCTTPDIFDLNYLNEAEKQPTSSTAAVTKQAITNKTNCESDPIIFEDEEDLMPTQMLPSNHAKPSPSGNNVLNEKENACVEKEQEDFITLSDKENRCPSDLEPISDLPPTQLLTFNEASSTRSSASTSSRKSIASKCEEGLNLNPSTSKAITNNKLLSLDGDEEDDRLTQAFLPPTKPLYTAIANPLIPAKFMNSTLLDDKIVGNKNPVSFFEDIEHNKTPQKQTKPSLTVFKMPERDFTTLRKTSSAASTNSESDLDLLMCTPQLIKEHMQVEHDDDFKKSLLAAKNKNLFGDDTDEEEDNRSKEKHCLVELINVPKDSKDFDKLLPHLQNNDEQRNKRKSTISEEQKAAKEAYKEYKFNVSFGQEQEAANKNKSLNKSATQSRDERHMGRDKEKDLSKKKEELKKKEKGKDEKTQKKVQKKQATRKTKDEEEPKALEETKAEEKSKNKEEQPEPTKQERPTRGRKRQQSSDKPEQKDSDNKKAKEAVKENHSKKEKDAKKAKETMKDQSSNKDKDAKKAKNTIKDTENSSVEQEPQQMPARRMTRLKSRLNDEQPSTSKEALVKEKSKIIEEASEQEGDELDSIPTQILVPRSTRSRSSSKHSESQDSVSSYTNTTRKAAANKTLQKPNKTSSAVSDHTAVNGSVSKTDNGRKRKGDTTTQPVAVERKRLRSTSSQDLSTIPITTPTTSSPTVLSISMTMVQPELFQNLVSHSAGLWTVAKNPAESQLLVMDKAYRTFKFLLAMARGIPIVTSEWLKKINETKSLKTAPLKDYIFSDAAFEKKHKFSFINSLKQARQKQRVFEDYEFLMTSGILPNPAEMKDIIEAAGGLVHLKSPPPARENQKIYLISSVNDKKDWHKFRRLNKNIIIISTEAIMSAVMRQSCLPLSNSTNVLA